MSAPEILIDQWGFSMREKKVLYDVKCMLAGRASKSVKFLSLETTLDIFEKGFIIPETMPLEKSEKHKTFCLFDL